MVMHHVFCEVAIECLGISQINSMLQSDDDYCPFHIHHPQSPIHLTLYKPCSREDIINTLHAMHEIIFIPALYLMSPVMPEQHNLSQDSAAGIVTILWAIQPRNQGSMLSKSTDCLSSSPQHPDQF